jgi:hypothetical protein
VAVSSDSVVVGAKVEDSNATGINGDGSNNSATNSGAAYVFVRNGTTWSQQAYLKASNTETDDNFGYSVAVSGDIVVVGARDEDSNAMGIDGNQSDNSAPSSGAAYVFMREGTNWSQRAYLKASNTETSDTFGYSVAVSGDTVAVGAEGEDSSATGTNGDEATPVQRTPFSSAPTLTPGKTWAPRLQTAWVSSATSTRTRLRRAITEPCIPSPHNSSLCLHQPRQARERFQIGTVRSRAKLLTDAPAAAGRIWQAVHQCGLEENRAF